MFSKVKIQRQDETGAVIQTINVPIVYGPKEKVFVRLRQDPDLTGHTYTTLPILAFQIVGYTYDSERKLNKNTSVRCYKDGVVTGVRTPVPYVLDIELVLLTKGTEDSLAVIEQIAPMFPPGYTMTIRNIDEMGIAQDVPITLGGISVSDGFEGDFATRRLNEHTFNFSAKVNLYGPIQTAGAITRTETDVEDGFGQHISEGDLETGEITADFWMENDNP